MFILLILVKGWVKKGISVLKKKKSWEKVKNIEKISNYLQRKFVVQIVDAWPSKIIILYLLNLFSAMSWIDTIKQKWQDKKLSNNDAPQSRDTQIFSPLPTSNTDLYKSDDDLGYC